VPRRGGGAAGGPRWPPPRWTPQPGDRCAAGSPWGFGLRGHCAHDRIGGL